MHVAGESDRLIVPKKSMNKDREAPQAVPSAGGASVEEPLFAALLLAESRSAESMEGRGLTEENTEQSPLDRTQSRIVNGQPGQAPGEAWTAKSRGLLGVREAARKDKTLRFTNLLHHLTPQRLRASFFELKKQAAPGVDQQTWHDYAEDIDRRIEDLHGRIHRGVYQAKPSKRTYIPKLDGKMRPLGIAAVEDKVVQQAARTVLESIYEEGFLGLSYGFRPGRSPHQALVHQALDALYVGIKTRKVNWIIDADIRGFFDNISHEWLMKFLEHRIADRRMLRLLKKWLKAGVSEDGAWSATNVGTPQGAVISPLYANVFLHYVLDRWINEWRQRHAKGEVIVVRYADDCVIGFREESDALSDGFEGAADQVWLGTASGQDATDRVWTLRGRTSSETRRRPSRDVRLSGLHAHQRENSARRLHDPPHDGTEEIPGQAERPEGEADAEAACGFAAGGFLAAKRATRLVPLLCGAGQLSTPATIPGRGPEAVASHPATSQPTGPSLSLGALREGLQSWLPSPKIEHPYPEVRFAVDHPR